MQAGNGFYGNQSSAKIKHTPQDSQLFSYTQTWRHAHPYAMAVQGRRWWGQLTNTVQEVRNCCSCTVCLF